MKHKNLIKLLKSIRKDTVKRSELIAKAESRGMEAKEIKPALRVPDASVSRGQYSVPKMLKAMESGFAAQKRGRKVASPVSKSSVDVVKVSNDRNLEGTFYPSQSDIEDELSLMGTYL
jgi:hypothetical protein